MNDDLKNFLGFAVIYGIPAIAFLRWKYKKWLQERTAEPEPSELAEPEESTSMIPAEARGCAFRIDGTADKTGRNTGSD